MKYNIFPLINKHRKSLMGFAALWIFLFHEWRILSHSIPVIGSMALFLKRIGFTGVDIFFCLSGMGLVYSIQKPGLLRYYKTRIRRIVFPYIVMAFVIYFFENRSAVFLLRNIFGINYYTVNIYVFLWFVPAIATLYILFPVYYQLFDRFKNKYIVIIISVFIWLLLSVVFSKKIRTDLFGFTNRIPVFLIGVLFGWIAQNKTVILGKTEIVILMAILALGVVLAYLTNYQGVYLLVPESNCCLPSILISVPVILLLTVFLELIQRKSVSVSELLNRILSFYGAFTLEFYCVQEYVGDKVTAFLEKYHYNNLIIDILLLISCSLTGWLLFKLHKYFWKAIDGLKKET